jgi:hypothetical protein
VVRDRKLLGVDVESVKNRAAQAVERLRDETAQARRLAEMLHPYIGEFCARFCG